MMSPNSTFFIVFVFCLFFQKVITTSLETVVPFKRWWNSSKRKTWIHSHATTPWLSWNHFHLKVRMMCYFPPRCNNIRFVFKRILSPKFSFSFHGSFCYRLIGLFSQSLPAPIICCVSNAFKVGCSCFFVVFLDSILNRGLRGFELAVNWGQKLRIYEAMFVFQTLSLQSQLN